MSPWVTLYAMVWIALVEFLLAMTPDASSALLGAHYGLGLAMVALAAYNYVGVRATRVPGRVKRTSQSTLQLSVVMALLGGLLVLGVGGGVALAGSVTLWGLNLFAHVFVAFAIITQAAAVAIAFDMWEEKEFAAETEPGEVPAMPKPSAPPRHA